MTDRPVGETANPLVLKLSRFVDLSPEDVAKLNDLAADVRRYQAKRTLIREGDRPEVVFLLLKGWACRYKVVSDGGRQIVAYLLPGDLCDVHIFYLKEMDHSIGLLSDAEVAEVPKQKIIDIFDASPTLARALWWSTLVDEGTLREWITNLGRRDAFDRLAHLFAELWLRMTMVGLTHDGSFDLPLTQEELGDTLGLTSVHINRTLQEMRVQGLVSTRRGKLHIPDVNKLNAVSGFEPNYLHLQRRPQTAVG